MIDFSELIEAIREGVTAAGRIHQVDGIEYSVDHHGLFRQLPHPTEPHPDAFQLYDAEGFKRAAQQAAGDSELAFVVVSHDSLTAFGPVDSCSTRPTLFWFNTAVQPIQFTADPEGFVRLVLDKFEDTPDRAALLSIVGNMKAEGVIEFDDDGVSTTVSTRTRVVDGRATISAALPSPIRLRPRRGWRLNGSVYPEAQFFLRADTDPRDDVKLRVTIHEFDFGGTMSDSVEAMREEIAAVVGATVPVY